MPTADFLARLKTEQEAFDLARREIIALSARAQGCSKRAIFSILRDDEAEAKRLLTEAEHVFAEIGTKASANARLSHEGSYRAALEEYAEARFVAQLAWKGDVSPLEGFDEETQIAGLCDALGEGVRLMTVFATAGRDAETRELKTRMDRVIAGLDAMDYSGYLRTKYDQARAHLRKAEEILYELSLRGR